MPPIAKDALGFGVPEGSPRSGRILPMLGRLVVVVFGRLYVTTLRLDQKAERTSRAVRRTKAAPMLPVFMSELWWCLSYSSSPCWCT